jgi:DNA-binding response OmpR family regulator
LLARLRALARRNTSALQVTMQLQPGSLNLLTREAQVDAVRIDLTVLEFALLEPFIAPEKGKEAPSLLS